MPSLESCRWPAASTFSSLWTEASIMKPYTQLSGVLKAHRSNVQFPMCFFFFFFCICLWKEKKAGGLKEPGGRDKERERFALNQEEQRRNRWIIITKKQDAGGVEKKIKLKEKEKGVVEERERRLNWGGAVREVKKCKGGRWHQKTDEWDFAASFFFLSKFQFPPRFLSVEDVWMDF